MRRLVAIVLAAGLVLVLAGAAGLAFVGRDNGGSSSSSGSADAGPTPVAVPDDDTATDPPQPDLAPFYQQRLAWTDCGDNRCARLRVPLDYRHPSGRTLTLAVLDRPADGAPIGSLVVNPGGPGAPGTSYASSAARVFGLPLLEHFDIVGFDPRGTGDSSPVDCASDAELDRYLSLDPEPSTASEVSAFVGSERALGRGCAARSGALAAHISTVESARDLDVLRSALGESTLTYLGASYGTELGATYAELFPRRVGRFVLDGAVDLSITPRRIALEQAAGFETALRAYVANCVDSSPSCFLGNSVDEGLATIRTLVTRIEQQPLPTKLGRDLGPGNAYYGISAPLYERSYWILLSAALRSALDGDGTALLTLSDAYTQRTPDGSYANNLMEAFYAITCLDDPVSVSPAQVPSLLPAFERASPTFGRVFAWSMTGCRYLTVRSPLPRVTVDAKGAAPIVVIGTTRDPATPYHWAQDLARQLDSGVLVTRDGDGHTGYHAGNACVDDAVEAYLVGGVVPRDGLRC
ncbi:MAG: alpha/beta hydrolase [Nocardioides sp.]